MDLMAEMVGHGLVDVSWTAPLSAPTNTYRIRTGKSHDVVTGTSHMLAIPEPGLHIIEVLPISQHFPYEAASVQVTVRGKEKGVV